MSFTFLTWPVFLGGLAMLAALLWLLQWLRVQHREVEVISTLFWQQAIEETRTRVFTKRFRHWWAWLLLVAICSLLWMLVGAPQANTLDPTHHVIMLDGNATKTQQQANFRQAIQLAGRLPMAHRHMVVAGNRLETLLLPHEPLDLARRRFSATEAPAVPALDWAVEDFAARATKDQPIVLHVVGANTTQAKRIRRSFPASKSGIRNKTAGKAGGDNGFFRVAFTQVNEPKDANGVQLETLGVAESLAGYERVDVWVSLRTAAEQTVEPSEISVRLAGQPLQQAWKRRSDGTLSWLDWPPTVIR